MTNPRNLLCIVSGHPFVLNMFGYACHDLFGVDAGAHHAMIPLGGDAGANYHIISYFIMICYIILYAKYYHIYIYVHKVFLYSMNVDMHIMPCGGLVPIMS